MLARIAGQRGWTDPHNHGSYTLESSSGNTITASRLTGDGQYTDQMDFVMTSTAAGGCQVQACSESQVTSYLDFSTNYCNLKLLLCGSQDGCPWVQTDLHITESRVHTGAGAGHDFSQCVRDHVTLTPAPPPAPSTLCPPGLYSQSAGNCLECPAGRYLPVAGSTSAADCIMCSAGQYSAVAGAAVCTTCAQGRSAPNAGSTACDAAVATAAAATKAATSTGNPACWSGEYTFARCCAGSRGDASCWTGQYSYEYCCNSGH